MTVRIALLCCWLILTGARPAMAQRAPWPAPGGRSWEALPHVPPGTPPAGQVPILVAVMNDRGRSLALRLDAMEALGRLGPVAAPAIPAITRALRDIRPQVRRAVVRSLVSLGSAAPLGVLVWAAHDRSPFMRHEALDALARLGPLAAPATLHLVHLSRTDRFHGVQSHALRALGAIGPAAAWTTRDVEAHFERSVPEVHEATITALLAIDSAEGSTLPLLLIRLRDDPRAPLRSDLARQLRSYGAAAPPPLVAELAAATRDSAPEVRKQAEESLAVLGPLLRKQGTIHWWAPVIAWWRGALLVALGTLTWFLLAAHLRWRPRTWSGQAGFVIVVGWLPALALVAYARHLLALTWATDYFPDALITVLTREEAIVTTLRSACLVAAAWVLLRRPPPPLPEEPCAPPAPPEGAPARAPHTASIALADPPPVHSAEREPGTPEVAKVTALEEESAATAPVENERG